MLTTACSAIGSGAPSREDAQQAVNAGTDELATTVRDEWHGYVQPMMTIAERLATKYLPEDATEQERHELYEFIVSQLSTGYLGLFYYDPAHPDFYPIYSQAFDELWANPDTVYGVVPIDPDGVYRLSGNRGTTRMLDFQLGGGEFVTRAELDQGMGIALENYDADSLTLAEDGSYAVILSAARPEGYAGDWWRLSPQTTYMMYRQVAYDWENEIDASIAIDRLDTPVARPRPGVEQLKDGLRQLPVWAENVVELCLIMAQRARARGLVHKFDFVDWGDEAFTNQRYFVSAFDLQEDEGLLIETEVPKNCGYWNFQLVSDSWRAINGMHYQSTINGHQARLDSDGMFRAVIANADPGIPNWLNTGGHNSARVYGRWNKCDSSPLPTATKIKLSELRDYLPEDTPSVDVAQRDAEQRARKRAFQLRRRW